MSLLTHRNACLLLVLSGAYAAAGQAQDADALAKQLANPIARLTGVPMQFNFGDGIGPDNEGQRFFLNDQPVIPVSISEDRNMISRTITLEISQSDILPASVSPFGLGDTVKSLFFPSRVPQAGRPLPNTSKVQLLGQVPTQIIGR